MDWMIPLQSVPSGSAKDAGLSERLLRHLFLPRQIGPGKQILDFGCGKGELARFLDSQSIRVVGCDPSAANIAVARRKAPQLSFFCVDPTDRLPVPEHEFDLVLARSLDAHASDLCGQEALIATAQLLSTLRPGGELVIVQRSETSREGRAGHAGSCFARHIGAFPGIVKVALVADSIFEQPSLTRLLGMSPAPGYITASLKLGSRALTRDEWHQIAETELAKRYDACCEHGATETTTFLPVARAA